MSYVLSTLGRDDATREIAEIHGKLASPEQRRALMSALGVRAEMELRAWWIRRDAEDPNKMGWPRQHFWARIAKRTAFDPAKTTEQSATVVVSDPALAAKINGATIKPTDTISPVTGKPRRALALPMNAEAYGKLPSSGLIAGLFVYRAPSGAAFLVRQEGTFGQFANLTFYYRLVPSVTVPKDPQALPPQPQLGAALVEAGREYFSLFGGRN